MKRAKLQLKYNQGFTILEVVVAIGIVSLLILAVSRFQLDVFSQNYFMQNSLFAEQSGRSTLKQIVKELREMGQPSTGDYPIAVAATSSITFYSDIDADGQMEKVRYFLATSTLQKGVTKLFGSPGVYDAARETVNPAVRNVNNGTTSIFTYYDDSYYGSSTVASLTYPMNISNIRLIQIYLKVDADPRKAPAAFIFTSQVTPRNLKDNL